MRNIVMKYGGLFPGGGIDIKDIKAKVEVAQGKCAKKLKHPPCPKCGEPRMMGPTYNKTLNEMQYVCICGYTTSIPPLDAQNK